jgi:N4-gp56 family major capsid protein
MAQFTWVFDAPTGTYKQHALSRRLYEAAVEMSIFQDHVRPVDGFGKNRGENVTLTRISNITEPTSATLVETDRIPEDDFAISTTAITVVELGRAVPYSSLSQDLSEFDLENPIQNKLRSQMSLTLDTKAAAAFKTAQVKYAITGLTSNNITTNATFGAASTANMNVFHAGQIRDYLFDTLHTPPVEGDDYVGIFRTLGMRGMKDDPDWEEWHKYTDPSVKFNSEVGRMENIRFIETNHANALGKVGTSSVLGEGVVFGEDGVAMAEAMSPELRAAIPSDFGRSKAVAWYSILEYGIIWDTGNAGEARIVHVGST